MGKDESMGSPATSAQIDGGGMERKFNIQENLLDCQMSAHAAAAECKFVGRVLRMRTQAQFITV